MKAIGSAPGARRMFVVSLIARLPLTMLSVGLLVHVHHLTGSFAAAGAVDGSYAISLGIGGPLLGRLIDRRRQTIVLVATALVASGLMSALAVLPVGTTALAPLALAVGLGLSTPPLGACVRTLFPDLLPDADSVRAAYAVDAAGVELTWIGGPPLALGFGALCSTGATLGLAGALLLGATLAFAAEPASRALRPSVDVDRAAGSAMKAPAMRTLVVAVLGMGVLISAVQVGVTATADALGSTVAAGPLLGVWGAGSLIGGTVAVRFGGGAAGAFGLSGVLAALTLGHLLLIPAAGSVLAMTAALLIGGAAIAPTYATAFGMVESTAPQGALTEAFAWLNTAAAIGAAAGAAAAGPVVDNLGPTAAFVLAAGAGVVTVATTLLRTHTLRPLAVAPAC